MFYGLIHDPELNAAVEEDSDEEEDKEKPKVNELLLGNFFSRYVVLREMENYC